MTKHTLILLLLISATVGTVEAKMYRWTDENGVTVYSQSPPVSGKAQEIKPPPPPPKSAATPPASPASNANSQGGDGTAESDDEDKQPSKEEIAESDKIKRDNCEAVTHNLDLYTNLGRKVIKTTDGLFKRLSEEERQAEVAKYTELKKEYCN